MAGSRRSRPLPPEPTGLEPQSPVIAAWLAAAWVIGFCVYFFSSVLPNSQPRISRPELLAVLPDYFLDYLTAEPTRGAPASGWSYFPQRFDLLAVAGLILSGAYCAGQLILRAVQLPVERGSAERNVLAAGIGLSAVSLMTLLLGLAGLLSQGLFIALLLAPVLGEGVVRWRLRRSHKPRAAGAATESGEHEPLDPRTVWLFLLGMAPFLLVMLLGSMQPDQDFDVREYHLEGPKEYFQAGRIGFLPHNVYTSFPFLTEMLSLAGMDVRGDWYRGALAGKAVLASFGPLTALAAYAAARRYFGTAAGWFAALIYVSTPWAYRISIIAYAEGGLAFFLLMSVLAALLTWDELRAGRPAGRFVFVTGLMAGSAMACKYPGVVSSVIPIGGALLWLTWRFRDLNAPAVRPLFHTAALYTVGVLLTVGPWLLKNLFETGNPVYPLLYSVFGGRDWDAALDAKFRAGHRPDDYNLGKLWFWITDVSARNDWLSPLLYGFAPLAWFHKKERRTATALAIYVAFLFAQWWLLTHRLDRFWVPMLPVVAVLAGAGAAGMPWRWLRAFVLVICLAFNLQYITSGLAGPNFYLADLNAARDFAASRSMASLNAALSSDSKVLCVGEAQVFDARIPLVYNTVFDRSIFQEWFGEQKPGVADANQPLRDPAAIRRTLREQGITHVFVNWQEVLRYRATYGYTDFVTPKRFADLVKAGVLGKPTIVSVHPLPDEGSRERRELSTWGRALIGGDVWTSGELYPVRAEAEGT